eukprot:15459311-Alexandrium_andersonii.AAC.1
MVVVQQEGVAPSSAAIGRPWAWLTQYACCSPVRLRAGAERREAHGNQGALRRREAAPQTAIKLAPPSLADEGQ